MAADALAWEPPLRARLGLALAVCALAVAVSGRARVEPRLPDGLLVEVVGQVPRPGVHLVARPTVRAAVEAAGGASTDATALVGGSRVVVRDVATVGPATDPLRLGHVVDLNEDGPDVLDALPGVGPATTSAILDHRLRAGPFRSIDEIAWVRGVGPATLAAVRPLVGVGDVAPRAPREALDLNSATAEALLRLPGIGPARAAAIVADREARGPFPDVASLDRVRGIGPATVEALGTSVVARRDGPAR